MRFHCTSSRAKRASKAAFAAALIAMAATSRTQAAADTRGFIVGEN